MICSCGLPSKQNCKEIFDAVLVREFSDFRFGRVHRLTVDAYALQHPAEYMASPKSFAAHLTGMCCAMEYGNDPELLRLLQRWLNGKKELTKPPVPEFLGSITVAHAATAEDGPEHLGLITDWAAETWKAYETCHDLAKEWIAVAKIECAAK